MRLPLPLGCILAAAHVPLAPHAPTSRLPRSRAPVCSADADAATVHFIAPAHVNSPFGATSPDPSPAWLTVGTHLAERLSYYDARLTGTASPDVDPAAIASADLVVVLGMDDPSAARDLEVALAAARGRVRGCVCVECDSAFDELEFVGPYTPSAAGPLDAAKRAVVPWGEVARGSRIYDTASSLLRRWSSEDAFYAIFFILHAFVMPIKLVEHSVSPTWDKFYDGRSFTPLRNAREFASMASCCGGQIKAAVTDPTTKKAIDMLNAVDMRDQVGSYRVVTSFETEELEAFSQCILQRNNCFGCAAEILPSPCAPLSTWRGEPLDDDGAARIFYGHLNIPEADGASDRLPWSWKIVCGANPAYDAFPCQHQIFYPGKAVNSMWYDPVFKVETVDGRQVWRRRHYRVRRERNAPVGTWRLSTLDNGVISDERWTMVDAADDLSWAVFQYSGAASVVGQSYTGALLCSADGLWPEGALSGPERERITSAFARCGLAEWELFGSRSDRDGSYMWSKEQMAWCTTNPPPLDPLAPGVADATDREAAFAAASS